MVSVKRGYLDKAKMVALILLYKRTGTKSTYEQIAKMFLLMATNIHRRPCFTNHTKDRKDEMISEATFNCVKGLENYDPTFRPQPFSYFTTTIERSFIQKINEYKRRSEIIKPTSYIENLEQKANRRSLTVADDIDNQLRNYSKSDKWVWSKGAQKKFTKASLGLDKQAKGKKK
jgi:DNA-directed RNA polymerase specialized sigma subunit